VALAGAVAGADGAKPWSAGPDLLPPGAVAWSDGA